DSQANLTLRGRRPTGGLAAPNDRAGQLPGTSVPVTDEQRAQQPPRLVVPLLAEQRPDGGAHGSAVCSCSLVQIRSLTRSDKACTNICRAARSSPSPIPKKPITIRG